MSTQDRGASKSEVLTFGSNLSSSEQKPSSQHLSQDSPETSPDPSTKKENFRKSKKDNVKKRAKVDKKLAEPKKGQSSGGSSALTKLDDLPSLGGPPQKKGHGRFGGGFIAGGGNADFDDESNDGFDDFDINEDAFGDSSNKFDDAEKHLKDFYKEESEGFKISSTEKKSDHQAGKKKGGFKVNIQGMNRKESLNDDDFEEEVIEEDI
jgi:hypothetical protein